MTTGRLWQRGQATLVIETTQRRAPITLRRRHRKPRVVHAERPEYPLLQHGAQGRAVESRQKKSEQVCRVAIVKAGTRLVDQRQRRQARDPLVRCEGIVDVGAERVRIRTTDRATLKIAVGQTGAVRQQIPERDRPCGVVTLIEWSVG